MICTYNISIAKNINEDKKKEQEEVSECLDLELIEVIKSTGGQYISQEVKFTQSDSTIEIVGIAKILQPNAGYMFILMKLNLINNADKKINFKLSNLNETTETEDKITLLYLATFDDMKKSYTNLLNINPPEIEPQSKKEIKLLAIAKDNCPILTLKYSDGNPIQVKLSSLPLSSIGNEQVSESEHKQVKTIKTSVIGKALSTKFKGEEFTAYATEFIPDGKSFKALASAYFDDLPAKCKKYAIKLGYKEGEIVRFILSEYKFRSAKMLPPAKE